MSRPGAGMPGMGMLSPLLGGGRMHPSAADEAAPPFFPGNLGPIGLLVHILTHPLLSDWIYIAAFTFGLEALRRTWRDLDPFSWATKKLVIRSLHRTNDDSYDWLMAFWEKHPSWSAHTRDFICETSSKSTPSAQMNFSRPTMRAWGRGPPPMPMLDELATAGRPEDAKVLETRLIPNDNSVQWIFHNWHLFRFEHTTTNMLQQNGSSERKNLHITLFARSRQPLLDLVRLAKEEYEKGRPSMLSIRTLEDNQGWRRATHRHKRPLSSIIIDTASKSRLLQDARDFLASEKWYNARGIPWRRGYLLHGCPGSGKTSTIQALASELNIDVYVVPLASPTMTDQLLASVLRQIPPRNILVMEDVDVGFSSSRVDNAMTYDGPPPPAPPVPFGYDGPPPPPPGGRGHPMSMRRNFGVNNTDSSTAKLSLSGLLNAIDGVAGSEGRILFMTTNHLSLLDPALTRPGRADLFIEYKKATRAQAAQLFKYFYPVPPKSDNDKELHESKEREREKEEPFALPAELTRADVERFAREWSGLVQDEEFSIAELQGMLLDYKRDPEGAAMAMGTWVSQQRAGREFGAA